MEKYFKISTKQIRDFENVCGDRYLLAREDVISSKHLRKFKTVSLLNRVFSRHGGVEQLGQYEVCLEGKKLKSIFITFSRDNSYRANIALFKLLREVNPNLSVIDIGYQVYQDTVISQG